MKQKQEALAAVGSPVFVILSVFHLLYSGKKSAEIRRSIYGNSQVKRLTLYRARVYHSNIYSHEGSFMGIAQCFGRRKW
ncbi:MAG: hypothetical protein R6W69_00805, partial [Anaerolineales bacterium]